MQRIRFKTLGVPAHVAHVHITRLGASQATVRHIHDFHEVFLVLEGGGTHRLNQEEIALRPGHLFALQPRDAHHFLTGPDQPLIFVNLAISTSCWRAARTVLGLSDGAPDQSRSILKPVPAQKLGEQLLRLASAANPLDAVQVIGQVHDQLLMPVARETKSPPAWLEALQRDLTAKPEFLGEPIGFWQRRSGRSPEHLARCCRRFHGVTLSEVINRARIERARHLLRTTDEKVIAIAFDCGFTSLTHFHRVFARLTGHTPLAWREAGSAVVPQNSLH
jgi:AraC family cel operon transcriptional repressor